MDQANSANKSGMTNPSRKLLAPHLSKSRIQSGRQCHKRLWLELHERGAIQWGGKAQARLDEGTAFGELARDLLGGGMLIDADHMHVSEALAQTHDALSRPWMDVPRLFEAAFEFEGVRVRVDALERAHDGDTLIEVKSSARIKDEYLWDCAIQTWVLRGSGRSVRTIALAHVNRAFVYSRKGDYSGLLAIEDVTKAVEALLPEIPRIVAELENVARGPIPQLVTGIHCLTPYGCPLMAHCRSTEPQAPDYPIELLPRGGAIIQWLRKKGYVDIRDVPNHLLHRGLHKRVATATRDNVPFVSDELATALGKIAYPRFYLDFETIQHIIPRWLGTQPFEQLPFQFSCHVDNGSGDLRHDEFIDVSGEFSLDAFVDRLIDVLGDTGPILVWNSNFEGSRIRALAERFPEKSVALLRMIDRLVDLLPIFREHYYHRDMRGSWSIKSVLPTIAPDLDYSDLAIDDGDAAQRAYLEATAPDTTTQRREELRVQMLAYCERDTLAMARLAQWHPEAKVINTSEAMRMEAK